MADITTAIVTADISDDGTTVTITSGIDRAVTVASYERDSVDDVAENQVLHDSETVQVVAGEETVIEVEAVECGQTDVFFSESAPQVPTLEALYAHAFLVGEQYGECVIPEPTTTTTVPATTSTTVPEATTTTVVDTTTTTAVIGVPTTVQAPLTPSLPDTGWNGDLALAGVSVLLVGVVAWAKAKGLARVGR